MPLFRRAARLLALGFISLLVTGAAPPGTVVHDVIEIEGKSVPLPPGEWHVTAQTVSEHNVVSLSLLRLHDGMADAAILIQTNQSSVVVDWGNPAACGQSDLYYAWVRYTSGHDGSCAYAAYVDATPVAGTAVDPSWTATLQRAAQSGWTVPSTWVVSAFCLSDRRDGMEVRYYFAPARAPSPGYLTSNGSKALMAWTRTAWDQVARGFRNRRGEAAPVALKDFHPADARAAEALPPEAPTSDDSGASLEHIGMKTLTFRIVATTADFTNNLVFVGDAALAFSMSAVAVVVGPVIFFLHELAWAYADAPVTRVLDLPGIGPEGPDPGVAAKDSRI